jgi:cytochrome c biogenesis protein CcmG, thiol:disulfide interchange protein DsbE
MKIPLRFVLPLAVFAGLVYFLAVGLKLDPREVPSPLIGKPAPEFALPRLDNPQKVLRRADLLGQVWLLNVWASWCVACRQEHPLLVELARRKAVPLYGLNYKDKPAAAQKWLIDGGNPYEASLSDESGQVGIDFGVYGVPETFVIDRAGLIQFKHTGPLTAQVLEQAVLPLVRRLSEKH